MPSFASAGPSWSLVVSTPPREVFAVMEQMIGTFPYQFQKVDSDQARIVEVQRLGFFGNWRGVARRARWVNVTAAVTANGTEITVEASRENSRLSPRRNHSVESRALQLITLLEQGMSDIRTIYRERRIPAGPVTLVASWAGTPYAVYREPSFDAPRGTQIYTGTPVNASGRSEGPFVHVITGDGTEGWVERDQIVAAPAESTRRAQEITARIG